MAKFQIKAGATSETVDVFIADSSSATGAGRTGLAYNTAGLTCYYNFRRGSSTAVSLATLAAANAAWTSGGFKEIDAANQSGKYRFDIPDALLAGGNGRYVGVTIQGAANMAPTLLEIELTGTDNQDAASTTRIEELWRVRGLDTAADVVINKTSIATSGIAIALSTTGEGTAAQETTSHRS